MAAEGGGFWGITVTPDPNNIMLITSELNHGVRTSVPHYLGVTFGFPVLVAAVGLGMGMFFTEHPNLHQLVSIVGAMYLLYLAWRTANAGNPNASPSVQAPLTFLQAASFQWVNPKVWVIAIGAIAAFTVPESVVESIAFILVSYLASGLLCMGIWLKLEASIRTLLQDTRRIRYFNYTMAVLLLLSLFPILRLKTASFCLGCREIILYQAYFLRGGMKSAQVRVPLFGYYLTQC